MSGTEKDATILARKLARCFRLVVPVQYIAGAMVMNARPLMAFQCVDTLRLGPAGRAAARAGLAQAASLGSLAELLLAPALGRLLDRRGRRFCAMLYLLVPTLTRSAVALVGFPSTRLRLLYLDLFFLRFLGVMQLDATLQTMLSDIVPAQAQPRARGLLGALKAIGIIVGSDLGGRLGASSLEASGPYIVGSCISAASVVLALLLLPETHPPRARAEPRRTSLPVSGKSALRVLLTDRKATLIASALALQESAGLPQINEVTSAFAREQLGWGPLEMGRFIGALGAATFLGGLTAGPFAEAIGGTRHVSACNAALFLVFFLWGHARSSWGMVTALPAWAVGCGKDVVLQGCLAARASELGLGRGEAMGAAKVLASFVRIATPLLLAKLYTLASQQDSTRWLQVPVGSPFFLVAAAALLAEAFHQASVHDVPRGGGARGQEVP